MAIGQQSQTNSTKQPPPPPPNAHHHGDNQRGNVINRNAYSNPLRNLLPPALFGDTDDRGYEEPLTASSTRPDNHQCYAMATVFLCFPVGICACMHSYLVDEAWHSGRYADSVRHSRQVKNYSCLGCTLGIIFWTYMLLFREPRRFEWPRWRWD